MMSPPTSGCGAHNLATQRPSLIAASPHPAPVPTCWPPAPLTAPSGCGTQPRTPASRPWTPRRQAVKNLCMSKVKPCSAAITDHHSNATYDAAAHFGQCFQHQSLARDQQVSSLRLPGNASSAAAAARIHNFVGQCPLNLAAAVLEAFEQTLSMTAVWSNMLCGMQASPPTLCTLWLGLPTAACWQLPVQAAQCICLTMLRALH